MKEMNKDRIIDIHKKVINHFEVGDLTPPKEGCVEGSIGSADLAKYYSEEADSYYSLVFASSLFFYLVRNHCFVDGNKRVAWYTLVDILSDYGLTLNVSDDEAVKFVIDACSSERGNIKDANDVSNWISERIVEM